MARGQLPRNLQWAEEIGSTMRILVLGGDGYLGWSTAMYFSKRGHTVAVVDNFLRRMMHLERGTDSLTPIQSLQTRVEAWKEVSG